METRPDELAGVADLFGGLSRAELREGLAELAYKRGEEYDTDAFDDDIEAAIDSYHLVVVEGTELPEPIDHPLVVPGPVAFPDLPEGATDLPHILDVEERTVNREAAATAARKRFESEARAAVESGDAERIETLLDVSYELEAWGAVDLSDSRAALSEVDE